MGRSGGRRGTDGCWGRHPHLHAHLAGDWAFHHLRLRQQRLDRGRGDLDRRVVAEQQPSKQVRNVMTEEQSALRTALDVVDVVVFWLKNY